MTSPNNQDTTHLLVVRNATAHDTVSYTDPPDETSMDHDL